LAEYYLVNLNHNKIGNEGMKHMSKAWWRQMHTFSFGINKFSKIKTI